MTDFERRTVVSPRGNEVRICARADTSDLAVIGSTFGIFGETPEDEYQLAELYPLAGSAIDIGAHVGSISLALLADNPDLRVTAIEPLAENVAVFRASLAENGWTDRARIVTGAIAPGGTAAINWNFSSTDYLVTNRYIGGMELGASGEYETVEVATVTLGELVTDDTVLAKLDCESCEWTAFRDPAVKRIPTIVAEGHGQNWLAKAEKLLGKSHDIEVLANMGGTGVIRAVAR